MAYTSIEKCGLYQDDCRQWSQKPRLEKTWSNFKDHFARAFKETRRSSETSKTEGYAANVKYTQANVALFTKMQQDHTMALENLATATQADRTSVALSKKTIVELSNQVSTLSDKLETSQSENTCLKISGHRSAPVDHGHNPANVQAPSNQNTLRDRNVYSKERAKNSTPTGIAHLTDLRLRSTILPRLATTWFMDTTNWQRGCTAREERYGTRIVLTAGQPSEGGRD